MKLNTVVSVSTIKDIEIWKIASPKIIELIEANNYQLFVPENHVNKFKKCSPSEYQIISEIELMNGLSLSNVSRLLPETLRFKSGWYYQQILKIQGVRYPSMNQINLIWDADTIPLKKLSFQQEDKILFYKAYYSSEQRNHKPYFETLKKIIDLDRQTDESFIAQCFPAPPLWVENFIKTIEEKSSKPWVETICGNLRGDSICEFSEYETLGNFFISRYTDRVSFLDRPWYRDGAMGFKGALEITDLALEKLSNDYDFVAFEEYMFKRTLYDKIRRKIVKALFW
jgi:hypothetical protein